VRWNAAASTSERWLIGFGHHALSFARKRESAPFVSGIEHGKALDPRFRGDDV
jgi:hypothetical protein